MQTHRRTGLFYNVLCHLFIIQRLVLTLKCFSPYLERSLDHLRNVYTVSSMCICACLCVCVGLCVCVCVSAFCVSVKVCCCSLEAAVSSSDWSLYTKSALYSIVTRGHCGASLRHHFLLCLWAFLQERKCHFMSVWKIINTAFSKHRKNLTFISVLSLPLKQTLSVLCPTSHLNPEERDATAYCLCVPCCGSLCGILNKSERCHPLLPVHAWTHKCMANTFHVLRNTS